MKIMLIRQSGRPSNMEKATQFESEWRRLYDRAEEKADKVFLKTTGKLTKIPRMIILQRYCRFIERSLTLKYGSEDWVEAPKSAKAWEKLIAKYEDTPILVARRADKGVVLILMDQLQS